jgi:rhamnosyltransferase
MGKDNLIIFITFNPDIKSLINKLKMINSYFSTVVVDNSASVPIKNSLTIYRSKNNKFIFNQHNVFIAAALNQGIRHGLKNKFQNFLLLDQDTNFEIQDIQKHIDSYKKLPDYLNSILGWSYISPTSTKPYFTRYGFFGKKMYFNNVNLQPADTLICSGMLFNRSAVKVVGFFDEKLIMDFVDHEWTLRAKSLGFNIYGNFLVQVKHHIGVKPIQFLGMLISNHSPVRHYYMFKNFFILMKRKYIPIRYKCHEALMMLFKFTCYSLLTKNKYQNFKLMLKGMVEGLFF